RRRARQRLVAEGYNRRAGEGRPRAGTDLPAGPRQPRAVSQHLDRRTGSEPCDDLTFTTARRATSAIDFTCAGVSEIPSRSPSAQEVHPGASNLAKLA